MSEETYSFDPAHTRFGFAAKHLMVTTVRGHFREYDGKVTVPDGDPNRAKVSLVIKTASLDTGSPDRDAHLRSADFFDVEKYPEMRFESTSIKADGGDYVVQGDLTIKDATRPVSFKGTVEGPVTDPWGGVRVGGEFTSRINRKDWGLGWNVALEAGGLLVSEEVKLEVEVELKAEVPA